MKARSGALTAVVFGVLVSGCGSTGTLDGDGVPNATSDELRNVVLAVHAAHPENTWWPHLRDKVFSGPIADVKVTTDYLADDPQSFVEAVAMCDAFLDAIQTESGLAVVYGRVTTTDVKIDGSTEDDEHASKLAEGSKGRGCQATPRDDALRGPLQDLGVPL